MADHRQQYEKIYDYLSAPDTPTQPEAAVVFGRKDPLVAYALGDLVIPNLVEVAIITGGIGKDSGDILQQGYRSEAHYLAEQAEHDAQERGYTLPGVLLDEKAANGGENARNSIALLQAHGTSTSTMTAVAHGTSLRRLAETLKFEAGNKTGITPTVHRKPSAYTFDPDSPADRDEAAAELLRIAEWPSKGWLGEQTDIPENLVDFVQDQHGAAPKPVASWQSAILRRLPKTMQARVIGIAAKHGRK